MTEKDAVTEPSGAERRKAARLAATHPVIIEWKTQEGEIHRARGTTRDIALGGVYCTLERPLPSGVPVEFNLVFPGQLTGEGHPLKLRCTGHTLRSEQTGQRTYGVAVTIEQSEVLEALDASADPGHHRIHARVVPAATLQADYPGMTSVVRDLSLAGAFIEDHRPLPVGRLFKVRLSSDRLASEIELAAIVRRVEPQVGMAVEFVALNQEAKETLQTIISKGRPWLGPQEIFPSEAWPQEGEQPAAGKLEDAIAFVREQAARVLPRLEILACHYRVGDRLFSLHLRDPVSQAELLLPISERWVRECQGNGDSTHLERALGTAARILDLKSPWG